MVKNTSNKENVQYFINLLMKLLKSTIRRKKNCYLIIGNTSIQRIDKIEKLILKKWNSCIIILSIYNRAKKDLKINLNS